MTKGELVAFVGMLDELASERALQNDSARKILEEVLTLVNKFLVPLDAPYGKIEAQHFRSLKAKVQNWLKGHTG
jgi:hypothetical protein